MPATIEPIPAAVRVGKRQFPFTSYAHVSAAYRGTIDRLGIGGSETPPCLLIGANGSTVGYVSYNGRVWAGDPRNWISGKEPVYSPMREGH